MKVGPRGHEWAMTEHWRPWVGRVEPLTPPVPFDRSGVLGPTKGQARNKHWRRSTHGFYVPTEVDSGVVEQRIIEEWVGSGPGAIVTGWAALRLHGAAFFDGRGRDGLTPLPVPVIPRGGRVRARPGLQLLRYAIGEGESVERHGICVTRPEVAVFDEIRRVPNLRQAVVTIDLAVAARITSLPKIHAYVVAQRGQRHRRLALAALSYADDNVASPQETRLRLVWMLDAGWPKPLTNCRVFGEDGRLLGVPDLLDPHLGVAAEYDGADHRDRERHRRDVRRLSDFTEAGLEVVTVVGADLASFATIVARLEQAKARARTRVRRWTLNPHERAE